MPDIKGRVKTIIMDKAVAKDVNDEIKLTDLGYDQAVKDDMIATLNSDFNISITPEQADQLHNIGETWILVQQLVGG
jgi:acyl carrier protein